MVKIYDFEKDFINFGINVYRDFGFDYASAEIFMILYMQSKEISMEELSKRTGYCLASISNKIKVLESLGIAKRIKKPGTKKVFYYMEKDIIEMQRRKVDIFYQKYIGPVKKIMPHIMEKIRHEKLDDEGKKKAEIITNYYKQIVKLEKLFEHLKSHLNKL